MMERAVIEAYQKELLAYQNGTSPLCHTAEEAEQLAL